MTEEDNYQYKLRAIYPELFKRVSYSYVKKVKSNLGELTVLPKYGNYTSYWLTLIDIVYLLEVTCDV